MTISKRSSGIASIVLSLLISISILTAPSAKADGVYCGYWVLGAIEAKYIQKGGLGGPLGCPTSNELTNPDGYGKRSHFGDRGIVYWRSGPGAHPVWGIILGWYATKNYERGAWKYPISDERNNSIPGVSAWAQDFQCGTVSVGVLQIENYICV